MRSQSTSSKLVLTTQGTLLLVASLFFAMPDAKATAYIIDGMECLDNRGSTISVGELMEQESPYGEVIERGPHIMLYPKTRRTLISKRLHKAGDHNPIEAKKTNGHYSGMVTNDFGERYIYTVSPVEVGLSLEIQTATTKALVYSETFKNCSKTK